MPLLVYMSWLDLQQTIDTENMRKAFLEQMRGIWAEVFYDNYLEREEMLKMFDEAMKRRFK